MLEAGARCGCGAVPITPEDDMTPQNETSPALLTMYAELCREEGYSAANWSAGSWSNDKAAQMESVRAEILRRMKQP